MEMCSYGCGNEAKYFTKAGKPICSPSPNSCPVNKRKNGTGLKKAYDTGIRKSAKDVYSDLPEAIKNKMNWNKGNRAADFSYSGKGNHKGVLIQERGHKCEVCGLTSWLDKPITLELEHVDGDSQNNVKDNLKLLCPNCHSQTPTWKGKNSVKKKSQQYVPSDVLRESLKNHKSIRAALLAVGLTGKGANYQRAYSLLNGE